MGSVSETGHARNVALFESLVEHCVAFGATYAPTNSLLSLTNLQAKLAESRASVEGLKGAKTAYDNATNAREIAFRGLRPLSTRLVNALAASGAAPQTVADAKTVLRRLRGVRLKSRPQEPAPAQETGATPAEPLADAVGANAPAVGRTVSVSHQSYDMLADGFASLIQVLVAEPLYTPNEAELGVAALQSLHGGLIAAATGVVRQAVAYENAIIARDVSIYAPDTGLVALAAAVKVYAKAIYGPSSPQYKSIGGLGFKGRRV